MQSAGINPTIKPTKRPVRIDIPSYGIRIVESHHERDFVMEPMRNRYSKIYFILDGAGNCYLEDTKVELEKEDLLVIPQGDVHYLEDKAGKPLSLYILALKHSFLGELSTVQEQIELMDTLAHQHCRQLHSHDYMAYDIQRMIKKILYEQYIKNTGYIPAIQGLLLNIVVSINRIYQNIPVVKQAVETNETLNRIQQVANYIATHFYEPISVENMAHMACLSIRQFTNQFKAAQGVTFVQFLHYQRVRFAQKLLTHTDRQITSICFESGFNDLAHFYRVFKKITGISPRKYRLNAIDNESDRINVQGSEPQTGQSSNHEIRS